MTITFSEPVDRRLKTFIICLSLFSLIGLILFPAFPKSAMEFIDIPLHLIGGALSAIFFIIVSSSFLSRDALARISRLFMMLITICFVSLITVLWECFELFTDTYFQTGLQASIAETLKDMIVGLIGGMSGSFCWPHQNKWKQN